MSTHRVVKRCKTVNKSKNKEAKTKASVKKITHQRKKIKVSEKTAIKKAFMMRNKPYKNKATEFY